MRQKSWNMQSVQIIQPQSLVMAAPSAEPAAADSGFGQAFAEEPETKSDPVIGADGTAIVALQMPTWFDVAGLTPGVSDTALGPTGPLSVVQQDVEKGGASSAEPAAGTEAAVPGNPVEVSVPALDVPGAVTPSEPAFQSNAAAPTPAQDFIPAPSDSGLPVTGPETPVSSVDTSLPDEKVPPLVAQDGIQPSGPVPAAGQDPTRLQPVGPNQHPAAEVVVVRNVTAGQSDEQRERVADDPGPGPEAPVAIPARKMAMDKGQPTADPGPDVLPPMSSPRATEAAVSVAPPGHVVHVTRTAKPGDPSAWRAEPARVAEKAAAPAPAVEISPDPAPTETDVPQDAASEIAPAAAPAPTPSGAGEVDIVRDPAPAQPAVEPEGKPVEATSGDTAPVADSPKTLLPGVWERLFTGILAPVVQQNDGTDALMAGLRPMVGIVPPRADPERREEPAPEPPSHAAMETRPPAGVDPRRATVEGVSAFFLPPGFDVSPTPDAMQDLGEDALPSTIGLTAPPASAAAIAGSPQAASAFPVPQVAAQISTALSRLSDGSTELALAPEELGKVRLKLKPDVAHPDRMVVMITFERPETLELFRRHAGELADALRAAGYAGADIGFGQDGSSASGSDRRDRPAPTASDAAFRPDTPGIAPPTARLGAGASLDLRL